MSVHLFVRSLYIVDVQEPFKIYPGTIKGGLNAAATGTKQAFGCKERPYESAGKVTGYSCI